MEDFINYYLSKNNSTSTSTKKTFKQNIIRIEKLLEKEILKWNTKTFNNIENIKNKLNDNYSTNTIINTILTISKWLEYKQLNKQKNKYDTLLLEYTKQRDKTIKEQKPKEEETKITYPELRDTVDNLMNDYLANDNISFSEFRNFLILVLYTQLKAPMRIGNFLDSKYKTIKSRGLKSLPKKYNYIGKMEDGKYMMAMNNYKTKKTLGSLMYTINNDKVNNLLDKWFDEYNTKKEWLLTNVSGKPISQTNFTNALKSITSKLFDIKLGNNSIRHLFATWFLSQSPSIEDLEITTRIMGQTFRAPMIQRYERRDENGDRLNQDEFNNDEIKEEK